MMYKESNYKRAFFRFHGLALGFAMVIASLKYNAIFMFLEGGQVFCSPIFSCLNFVSSVPRLVIYCFVLTWCNS